MNSSNQIKTVLKYIESINRADLDKIAQMMDDDYVFVDAGNLRYEGKDIMIRGWKGYFMLFPDYSIEVQTITGNDSDIGLFGYSSGTYKGLETIDDRNYFRIPTSWMVKLEGDKVRHWQVYNESKMVEDIINQNKLHVL